jgi:restriction system protein
MKQRLCYHCRTPLEFDSNYCNNCEGYVSDSDYRPDNIVNINDYRKQNENYETPYYRRWWSIALTLILFILFMLFFISQGASDLAFVGSCIIALIPQIPIGIAWFGRKADLRFIREIEEEERKAQERERRIAEEERRLNEKLRRLGVAGIDNMDGHDFERFCVDILKRNGFQDVVKSPGSGDRGVDITCFHNGKTYAIQCKRFQSDVSRRAVQEIFTGKTLYDCDVGIILTNSNFTKSAIKDAEQLDILLWGRSELSKLIEMAK